MQVYNVQHSPQELRVPLVWGPRGQVFVFGVVIPRIWGPGIETNCAIYEWL